MKYYLIPVFTLGLLASSVSAQDKLDLTDSRQKISYALGMDIYSTLQNTGVDVDAKELTAGIADMLAGKPVLTGEQQKNAIIDLSKELAAKQEVQRKLAAANNLKAGHAFLATNASKAGINLLAAKALDGSTVELQYEIIKSGAGPSPQKSDIVEVHYVGSLIDGTVFDSSVKRGFPATFGMNQIIPGWAAALQKMKAGDKWRLYIPAELGYGEYGPPQLPPNSTTIYDVELLSFYTPSQTNSTPVSKKPVAPAN
jgi:FKBP-type peptidyl-prolyl cis-trans isomerase